MTNPPRRWELVTAFGAVYLIWGSTYLGILYAIESIPPLLMAGSRFAIAGAALLLMDRLRGASAPGPREWKNAAVTGVLLLGIGNGGVTWAEQSVPSGVAALVASAVPIWMTLMDWLRPGGIRPSIPTAGGLVLGGAGLIVLLSGDLGGMATSVGGSELGVTVLIISTIGWALGSVVASQIRLPASPVTMIGAQMTAGGLVLVVAGLFAGEAGRFDLAGITTKSTVAWLYLVVFGSLVGFSAYIWLLRNTTPAKASTYAFVNPVVAMFLGVWLASERPDARTVAAMTIILAGVALIVLNRGQRDDTMRDEDSDRRSRPLLRSPTSQPATPIEGRVA